MKNIFNSILIFTCFSLTSWATAMAQEAQNKIDWQHFVNVDFELSMPVSKTNIRPVEVPTELSLVRHMLQTVAAYDLIAYNGSNDEFYSTVQVTAFADLMSMEGIATKLLQQIKVNYTEVQYKELVFEQIERIGNQRKLYLAYRGEKEHYSIIMMISERRVITILLSDVSTNQKWTKKFLDAFHLF